MDSAERTAVRAAFQQHACAQSLTELAPAVRAARDGEEEGRLRVAAMLCWAAFACPAAIARVYDVIESVWLNDKSTPEALLDGPEAPLYETFWSAFWSVIDDAEQGYDAASITARVASLGGAVHASFQGLAEAHAAAHEGAANAAEQPMPGRTELAALAELGPGTLGGTLHHMLVANGYDVEVLDREAIQLVQLPPALRYLNTRILQMHDVWHLVAGYETTASHEVAISAFQLAQFGHNYSGMFLAVAATLSHFRNPEGFGVLMQLIAEAWRHGRRTPPLMAIEWEAEWASSIEDIRARYGIAPFESVFPADLFEQLAASA